MNPNIILNGETRTVSEGDSVQDLIEQLNLSGKRLAVEVNLEIIPRSQYASRRLDDGDRVEIVQAIGGG